MAKVIVEKFGQLSDLVGMQQSLKLLQACGDQQLKAKMLQERLASGEETERVLSEWRKDIQALEGRS